MINQFNLRILIINKILMSIMFYSCFFTFSASGTDAFDELDPFVEAYEAEMKDQKEVTITQKTFVWEYVTAFLEAIGKNDNLQKAVLRLPYAPHRRVTEFFETLKIPLLGDRFLFVYEQTDEEVGVLTATRRSN